MKYLIVIFLFFALILSTNAFVSEELNTIYESLDESFDSYFSSFEKNIIADFSIYKPVFYDGYLVQNDPDSPVTDYILNQRNSYKDVIDSILATSALYTSYMKGNWSEYNNAMKLVVQEYDEGVKQIDEIMRGRTKCSELNRMTAIEDLVWTCYDICFPGYGNSLSGLEYIRALVSNNIINSMFTSGGLKGSGCYPIADKIYGVQMHEEVSIYPVQKIIELEIANQEIAFVSLITKVMDVAKANAKQTIENAIQDANVREC